MSCYFSNITWALICSIRMFLPILLDSAFQGVFYRTYLNFSGFFIIIFDSRSTYSSLCGDSGNVRFAFGHCWAFMATGFIALSSSEKIHYFEFRMFEFFAVSSGSSLYWQNARWYVALTFSNFFVSDHHADALTIPDSLSFSAEFHCKMCL